MSISKAFGGSGVLGCIVLILLAPVIAVCAAPAASGEPTTRPAGGGDAFAPAGDVPKKPGPLKHLKIDRPGRRVIVDATVMLRKGLLEFVLCRGGVKDHETLLTTDVPPSSLHAALLVLGLAPGRPAQWITPAGKKPVFVSPRGAGLEISVKWTDKEDRTREVPITDWMMEVATKKKMHKTQWVFVGSDFLDNGRYWADLEGLHITVTNFPAGVIDVPFKSTDKNAFLEFAANPAVVPPKGTPVKLIIKATKGSETAPAARMSFSVDALGRIKMDGIPVVPENIARAVRRFLSRHADASAVVRIDSRALLFDHERLKEILEQAGLKRIRFRVLTPPAEILPRTSAETARALAWWKDRFGRAEELIVDPAEDAAAALRHIERRRKQIEELSELWADYATRLKAALNEHAAQKKKQEKAGDKKLK